MRDRYKKSMRTLDKVVKKLIESRELIASFGDLLKSSGLTIAELEVLYTIKLKQKTQPSEIADYLLKERAIISRCVRSLNEMSLIHYHYDDTDRRKVFISLTKEGEKVLELF